MIPVILSGGSGTRLWPVSRSNFPKQFCELLDESLFVKTVKRLAPLGSPWVITVREMQKLTEGALSECGVSPSQAIYEPRAKNTAPAVALVCKRFELLGRADEIVGIFPADHLIDDVPQFQALVRQAAEIAAAGEIVTLGISPTYPATGYGYIATSDAKTFGDARRATGFREKPNEETARDFLSHGGYYWNAGMFIFRVSDMIGLFKKYSGDVWSEIDGLQADMSNLDEIYSRVRSISVDYAIMERLPHHVCLPCDFGWSDLGSWDSIADVVGDKQTAAAKFEVESEDNFVFAIEGKTYCFAGVRNLVVVDTPDATLIANRGDTELVKQLVDKLKAGGRTLITEQHQVKPK